MVFEQSTFHSTFVVDGETWSNGDQYDPIFEPTWN